MSRQMKHFADYFMQGMQLGGQWAEKWEARRIAAERNKLKAQQDAIREAREERKLAIYGQGVAANAEAAKARAYRIMNPIAKGGGGKAGAGAADDAAFDTLQGKWAARDLAAGRVVAGAPPEKSEGSVTNNYLTTDGTEGSDAPVPDPPAAAPVVQEEARGGMVRKMAGGGSIEEGANMSIGQAMSYGSKPKAAAGGAGGVGGALAAGIAKGATSKGKDTITEDGAVGKSKSADAVTPRGPMGSGVGGSYTPADSAAGGVLDTGIYRGGGRVRRFERGGMNDDSDHVIQPKTGAPSTHIKLGKGSAMVGANYDPNGQYIQGEVGYEHPVGNNLKLGVQGDYGKYIGPGGNEAKPDWGVGIRGKLKFNQGGTVRRFQSGGRVMETAIDTGTSGPGSGYGYRAAPPARR